LSEHISECRKEIDALILRLQPDEIFIPFSDGHPDHNAANDIFNSLSEKSVLGLKVREYLTWAIQKYTSSNASCSRDEFSKLPGVKQYDISGVLPKKIEAIGQYKSQTTEYWPSQKEKRSGFG